MLILYHKVILGLQPSYLQNYLTPYDNERLYSTRYATQKSIKTFRGRTKGSESSFFPIVLRNREILARTFETLTQ